MCNDCGLVTISPHPSADELTADYHTYLPENPEEISVWKAMMRPVIVKSARLIETEFGSKPGRLLDVGTGYGFFLEEMKSRGWEVAGIELSVAGRKHCQRNKIPVHSHPIDSLSLPQGHFDVVTLFYVIEHLIDPVSTMKEVNRILKPGGLVLLRWPHSTPILRLLGPFSKKFDLYHTPYHLYDFSPKTIRMLLHASAFEQIRTAVGGHTLPPVSLNRWAAIISGTFAEAFYRLSGRRILFPGVSKTTMAKKSELRTIGK
jgi:SAM-dependent methyltransferase